MSLTIPVHRSCGFTIVELMAVVAIIGVLAAVAIPPYSIYVSRAKVAEAFTITANARHSIAEFYAHRGQLPTTNAAAGIAAPENLIGRFVQRVEIVDGAIHVQVQSDERESSGPWIVSIRPVMVPDVAEGGTLSWVCGFTEPAANMLAFGENRTTEGVRRHLPTGCRRPLKRHNGSG